MKHYYFAVLLSIAVAIGSYLAMVALWKVTTVIASAFAPWVGGGILFLFVCSQLYTD